jgi:hypothetical protein
MKFEKNKLWLITPIYNFYHHLLDVLIFLPQTLSALGHIQTKKFSITPFFLLQKYFVNLKRKFLFQND